VPPRWSNRDWFEEMEAEAAAAALQAERDFDPTRGVPWGAFLHRRVMHAALDRLRREWTFAIHRNSHAAWDEFQAVEGGGPSREAIHKLLQDALGRLLPADAGLIADLYWEGKTEAGIGETLGISQQAVSKRKQSIFKSLRKMIGDLERREDLWW
jgi:RNA polymerase sigma factor (sigma-70 family)